jgi:hypothetical protein
MRNAIRMIGLAMGLVLSGCGGTEDGAEVFVGTWHPILGAIRRACPGAAPTTESVRDIVWSTGVETDLVSTTALTPCRLKAEVVAGTAVGVPDDKCTVVDRAGGLSTVVVNRYAFVVSPNGRTATESAAGQITRVDQGVATACSFEATALYQKVGE